jgi:hypothetical protein
VAYGLQTWDANGNVTLTVTDRLTRFYGSFSFSTPSTSPYTTFISIPGAEPSTWFAYTDKPFYKIEVVSGGVNVKAATYFGGDVGNLYVFRS